MKKLNEALGLKGIPADVGIEIECEGENISAVTTSFWKTEQDGSLRGEYPHQCAEFVLKKPILAAKVSDALDQLIGLQAEARFEFSYRTSVHVHVNCLDMSVDQILTFAYAYLIFEEPLLNFCGEGRKGNRFCLRLRDAENQLRPITWIIDSGFDGVRQIEADRYRYAAMNLAALSKYGSIEFRAMRGNMDKDVLSTWVTALLELRAFALSFKNPKDLYDTLAKTGAKNLFDRCFPTCCKALEFNGMERNILESVSLAIEIPFDWEKKNAKKGKRAEKLDPYEALRRAGDGQIPVPGQLPEWRMALRQPGRARDIPQQIVFDEVPQAAPEHDDQF